MKVAAALAAGLLAILNLGTLIGAGYARYAAGHLDRPDRPATLIAAQIAARSAPWSSTYAALAGWIHAENNDAAAARAAYARALRLAPGDPLLWAEYAQALGRLGQFDEAMTTALRQAAHRAPTSEAVQRAIAEQGLAYWERGTASQREQWLAGMRHELLHNRGAFLGYALTRGQGATFCRGPALELHQGVWCERIASALTGGCYVLTPTEPMPCEPAR